MLLKVVWRDSGVQHSDGWSTKQAILKTALITNVVTVGTFMHETEDTLYIALSVDYENDLYFGVQAIWKPDIISREALHTSPACECGEEYC